ncbi:unnamed protein product [Schistosoma mattheei]|uniref:Uncharacterized protein n=1 Tax=Schistosoma mattheei TaxID=31246 RepID=A0A183Q7I9_9TREM|nr:unnamed protein product [Schistosoma mattheei]
MQEKQVLLKNYFIMNFVPQQVHGKLLNLHILMHKEK